MFSAWRNKNAARGGIASLDFGGFLWYNAFQYHSEIEVLPVEDIKSVIAKNITALRQGRKMTQIELAEKLNYSDKAISKWERGESIPDVTVLKSIADLFGVTLDYLVQEEHTCGEPVARKEKPARNRRNCIVVTALSILLVWFVATLCFVVPDILFPGMKAHWLTFVYAVPVTMIVWLVFNSIWFRPRWNYMIISLLMWTTLASIVITLAAVHLNVWQLFLLGIPGQVIILVWSRIQYGSKGTVQ